MFHLGQAGRRPNRRPAQFAAVLCALSLVSAARAGVVLVDPSTPGAFTQIQPAIDVALDQDIILVRPLADPDARYEPFTVGGKTIAIVGEVKLGTVRCSAANISAVPLGSTVILRGLDLRAPEGLPAISVAAGAGGVRLEELDAVGGPGVVLAPAPALRITASDEVYLAYCDLTGGAAVAGGAFTDGVAAFDAWKSEVAVRGGSLTGGAGADNLTDDPVPGGRGGSGSKTKGGTVLLSNVTIVGGAGGQPGCVDEVSCDCGDLGGGGDAIVMKDTVLVVEASTLVPGSADAGACPATGTSGLPIVAEGGVLQQIDGTVHHYWMSSPVQTPIKATFHMQGTLGEAVYLSAAIDPLMKWMPKYDGYLMLSGLPLMDLKLLRVLDTPDGTHDTDHPVPPPPPGIDSFIGYTQSFFVLDGKIHLGPMSSFLYIGYGP